MLHQLLLNQIYQLITEFNLNIKCLISSKSFNFCFNYEYNYRYQLNYIENKKFNKQEDIIKSGINKLYKNGIYLQRSYQIISKENRYNLGLNYRNNMTIFTIYKRYGLIKDILIKSSEILEFVKVNIGNTTILTLTNPTIIGHTNLCENNTYIIYLSDVIPTFFPFENFLRTQSINQLLTIEVNHQPVVVHVSYNLIRIPNEIDLFRKIVIENKYKEYQLSGNLIETIDISDLQGCFFGCLFYTVQHNICKFENVSLIKNNKVYLNLNTSLLQINKNYYYLPFSNHTFKQLHNVRNYKKFINFYNLPDKKIKIKFNKPLNTKIYFTFYKVNVLQFNSMSIAYEYH